MEILQLVHEISSFPDVLYKRGDLKNFSKFSDKHRKQSSDMFCQKKFLKVLQNSRENNFLGDLFLTTLQAVNCQKQLLEMFCKKDVLKNFANFTEIDVCWSLFLIKLKFWGTTNLLMQTMRQVLRSQSNLQTF